MMKNKKWWIKFKRGKLRLIILIVVSFTAGLSLLIDPRSVSELVIRGVGLVWVMEGISYFLNLKKKINKQQINKIDWLKKNRRFISIRAIEKELNMPSTTLDKHLTERQKMSDKWLKPLNEFINELKK